MSGVQQAAEAAYPQQPDAEFVGDGDVSEVRAAFIAGAEWALEQAERIANEAHGAHIDVGDRPLPEGDYARLCPACLAHRIAAAIRSLSTTTIPISESSGSDSENTITEETDA